MRMFDIKNSWLDDEGKPLIGRVKFCKLHTTVLENIYNMDGTVVYANPQYTNTIGQLQNQVFLKDNTDYTVRFEKYVGNGDMTEDQDNWLDVYSCDDIWDTYGIEIDATSFQVVNNITDLRQTNPNTIATRDNKKIILLAGYNVIGDKPQVLYEWDANNTDSDNGGNIIKVENISNGRWILVDNFEELLDVRHFGVFGADSKSEATDLMSIQINVANQYASLYDLVLFFPAIDGLTWYKMNGLNLWKVVFSEETRVFGNTNYPNIITMYNENGYLDVYSDADYKAVFTIRGSTVRTSWGVNSDRCIFEPSYKLIVDSEINTNQRDFHNIIIDCLEQLDTVQLYGCEINAINKFGDNCYFDNCIITENMFTESVDYNTITISTTCNVDLNNFDTVSVWADLYQRIGNTALDFRFREVDDTTTISYYTKNIINAKLNNLQLSVDNISFENCDGSVVFTNEPAGDLSFENSVLTIDAPTPTTNFCRLTINSNSSISFVRSFHTNVFVISNSIITIPSGNLHSNTVISAKNATINCSLSLFSDLTLVDSIISGVITQASHTDNMNADISGCTLYGTYTIGSAVPLTKFNGRIERNNSTAVPAIDVVRTNMDSIESHHSYSYKNNTGTFLENKITSLHTYNIVPFPVYSATLKADALNAQNYYTLACVSDNLLVFNSLNLPNKPLDNIQLFSIGTDDCLITMKILSVKNTGSDHAGLHPFTGQTVVLIAHWTNDNNYTLFSSKATLWPSRSGWYWWYDFPSDYNIMAGHFYLEQPDQSYNLDLVVQYEKL